MEPRIPGEIRLQRQAEPEAAIAAETRTLVIGPYPTKRDAHGEPARRYVRWLAPANAQNTTLPCCSWHGHRSGTSSAGISVRRAPCTKGS